MIQPSAERIAELKDIYRERLEQTPDLGEYHDWDDLVECVDEREGGITFEEWDWMRENYTATLSVALVPRDSAARQSPDAMQD